MEIKPYSRLRTLREKLEISQKNMANLLAVSPSYYSDIENGRRTLTDKFINKIVSKTNANEAWITTGVEPILLKGVQSVVEGVDNEVDRSVNIDFLQHETAFRLDNYFKNDKDLESVYNDAMEILMFRTEHNIFIDKYLRMNVHATLDDRQYVLKNINAFYEQIRKLKQFKKAISILAEGIRNFNSEMYDAGDNDFAITQIHRIVPNAENAE